MKLYITSFLVVFFLFVSIENKIQAQETFAPIGTTWLFKVDNAFLGPQGYNKIVSTKDTMMFGREVRQLRYEIFSRNRLNSPEPLYVYQSNDSIYQVNPMDGKIRLLFRNDMESGDTLKLLTNLVPPEERTLVVDSVKVLDYRGFPLKEMYLSVTDDCIGSVWTLINSRFGPITGIEFVDDLCSEGISELLICYEDPDFEQIQFYPIFSCDIETSVDNSKSNISQINLWPNPATSHLVIDLQSDDFPTKWNMKIFTLTGHLLRQQSIDLSTPQQLDLSDLPSGILFLQIEDEQGRSITRKLVKE